MLFVPDAIRVFHCFAKKNLRKKCPADNFFYDSSLIALSYPVLFVPDAIRVFHCSAKKNLRKKCPSDNFFLRRLTYRSILSGAFCARCDSSFSLLRKEKPSEKMSCGQFFPTTSSNRFNIGHTTKKRPALRVVFFHGMPDAIRTHGTWRRRPLLYPTELRAHIKSRGSQTTSA